MRMPNSTFALALIATVAAAASCTLITDVDRTKIPPPSPGTGGTAGAGGTGGTSGTGGTGGTGGDAGQTSTGGSAGDGGSAGETAGGSGGAAGGAGESGAGAGGAGGAGEGGGGGQAPICTRATGTITLTPPNMFFEDGDTFVIDDGINDPVTFEFDCGGSTVCSPLGALDGVGDGNVGIDFDGLMQEAEMADLIVTAINSRGTSLYVSAVVEQAPPDGGAGAGGQGGEGQGGAGGAGATNPIVIQLSHDFYGARGNQDLEETLGNPNFVAEGMSGGQAVSCESDVTACSDDDECESNSCDTATHLCE